MAIKVFIVDDSAVVREVLGKMLSLAVDIQVVGSAPDPLFALDKLRKAWPDVIVTDVEMPRMDGVSFIRQVMAERPTPILVCSSLTQKGAAVTLEALSAGALSVVAKPVLGGVKDFLEDAAQQMIGEVRAIAGARLRARPAGAANPNGSVPAGAALHPAAKLNADAMLAYDQQPPRPNSFHMTEKIIAIGISTGGTQALEYVLPSLPRTVPGMAIVQHMPEKFTANFAERLNKMCQIEVREARSGDRLLPGLALIAPGGKHLLVKRSGAQYLTEVKDGPQVARHRPSADVLFRSVAIAAGPNALGIIMTGMGDDGARGLKEMHDCGARTIAQDEDSCVVFGMPREAIALGAVDDVLSIEQIVRRIGT